MAVDDDIRTGEDAACVYPYLLECDSLYFLEKPVFVSLQTFPHSNDGKL